MSEITKDMQKILTRSIKKIKRCCKKPPRNCWLGASLEFITAWIM